MQVLPAKRREGQRNQNEEHPVNLCQLNILDTTYKELARILFPDESKNDIK